MRHPTEPANHKLLNAVVVGLLVCFAGFIAWQSDKSNDTAIRWQMASQTRSQ